MLSQEKHDFLLEYPWLVSSYVAFYLPLTQEQLRRYYDLFDWEYICENEAIQWNTDIIDEFVDDLLPVFTEENDPGYPITELSTNRSVPWSVELIDRYIDRWNWGDMVCNHILPHDMRIHYRYRLSTIEEYDPLEAEQWEQRNNTHHEIDGWLDYSFLQMDIEEMAKHPELCIQDPDDIVDGSVDWDILSSNEFLPWSEELISRFHDRWNWWRLSSNDSVPWSEELLMRFANKWEWKALSRNPSLPWTESFITRYGMYWNWYAMSENEGLPWSYDFLRKFSCFLKWGQPREERNGTTTYPEGSINNNYGIPWTAEMWDAFHDRLDSSVVMSLAIHWDFETMKCCCKHWGAFTLLSNREPFLTAFPELQEPETVISLMDEILERYKRGDYQTDEGEE
jgi:hypothetical protein